MEKNLPDCLKKPSLTMMMKKKHQLLRTKGLATHQMMQGLLMCASEPAGLAVGSYCVALGTFLVVLEELVMRFYMMVVYMIANLEMFLWLPREDNNRLGPKMDEMGAKKEVLPMKVNIVGVHEDKKDKTVQVARYWEQKQVSKAASGILHVGDLG